MRNPPLPGTDVIIHETACVDNPCTIGPGTKIWHFCHIMAGAEIGRECNLGQNVFVAGSALLGNNVKVQNNVSIYDGCVLEDEVFCGPSVVFTNVKTPRSAIVRKGNYSPTYVERGATLGANSTIVCGVRIGHHAFIAAGAVVTADVVPYALMTGVPARRSGWVGRAGLRLREVPGSPGGWVCPETGERYRQINASTLVPDPEARPEQAPAVEAPIPLADFRAQFRDIEEPVRAALERVLDSQRFILGEEVVAFEAEIAAYAGVRHAVGCASGSDALLLTLMALDLAPGDEVLTTPYTFFATAGAIWRLGLRAVFCDIDLRTYNLDVASLARHRTARTRAIMPVHLFGQCAAMGPLLEFAREHGLAVIEDAAQALGARYEGRMAGSLGTLGCYSFFPSKNLGGYGDGGMVVTDNDALAARLRSLRTHGASKKYYHEHIGINSRLDAIQAAILRAKFPHLEIWAEARRAHAAYYETLLIEALPPGRVVRSSELGQGTPAPGSVVLPAADTGRHVFNQYVIRVAAADRDPLRAHLKQASVATEVYYPLPMHLQPCAKKFGYKEGECPRAELASRQTLAIPVYPEMLPAQQRRVTAAIGTFFAAR